MKLKKRDGILKVFTEASPSILHRIPKLINYSLTDDPIRLLQFGQVHGP